MFHHFRLSVWEYVCPICYNFSTLQGQATYSFCVISSIERGVEGEIGVGRGDISEKLYLHPLWAQWFNGLAIWQVSLQDENHGFSNPVSCVKRFPTKLSAQVFYQMIDPTNRDILKTFLSIYRVSK